MTWFGHHTAGTFPYLAIPYAGAKALVAGSVLVGAASFTMPSPESVIAILGAVALGWAGIRKHNSSARAEAIVIVAKAEAEAYRIKDEARKTTISGQLESALSAIAERDERIGRNEEEIRELKAVVAGITEGLKESGALMMEAWHAYLHARDFADSPTPKRERP